MPITNEYTIKISVKEAKKNVEDINLSLQEQKDLLNDIQREIESIEDKRAKANPKDQNRIRQYNQQLKEAATLQKRTKLRVQETKQAQVEANKVLKEAEKNQADFGGVLGFVDKQTGGAVSGMQKFTKSITGATKGFKLMKIAWMATGLGALVVLITSLVGAFTRSEEGQEKFARGMAMIGAVVDQALDLFANLGTGIIDAFMNPVESLKNFGKTIQEFVMDKVELVIDGMGLMGSALSKLFSGDFSGALDDAGEGFVKLNRGMNPTVILTEAIIDGTKKLIKATGDLIDETGKEIDVMNKVTKMRQKAHHIERDLQIERAKADREINDIRLKAEDRENQSAEDRIILLRKAQAIEEEITKKEIKAKQMLVDAMILEQSISLTTIEEKDKLAKLQAELIKLDTKKLRSQRLLQTQITTAVNEEIAAAKTLQNFKDSLRIKDEENRFAEIEQEKNDRLKSLEDLKATETEKQQIKLDIEQAFKDKKKLIEDEEKEKLDEERQQFLESEIEKEDLNLEDQRTKALDELTRLEGTDQEKLAINTKYDKLEADQDKIKRDAEIDMAKQTFSGIANLLGENSKAGKAAAVAAALINTYQGITAELQTKTATPFGFALKLVNIASTASIGFKAVKSIMATNAKSGGGSPTNPAAGAGRAGAEETPPIPPSFNIVGSSGTNQLADAIGGQSQQPVQAFVVASEVTNAQALERNTIEGATIG
tara:strand:- start:1391 stop:3532 length:2142 start_codon:yes stop_codon:yes gene_type:complete